MDREELAQRILFLTEKTEKEVKDGKDRNRTQNYKRDRISKDNKGRRRIDWILSSLDNKD